MMTTNSDTPTGSFDDIALATRVAMDQMLMYFAQSYTSDKLKPEDLITTYLLAIISTLSIYLGKISHENRVIIESEIRKILLDTSYSKEEIELAKMPVMGNA